MFEKGGFKTTLLLILMGPMIFLGSAYFLIQSFIFQPLNQAGEEVFFEIITGEGAVSISQRLEEEGIIKNAYAFFAYNIFLNQYNQIKAGRYLLSPSMTVIEISKKIIKGDSLPEIKITFPEGWNLKQWQERTVEYFPEINLLDYRVEQFKDDFEFLEDAPPGSTLEGYLYPDTYYFNYQTEADEVVRTFLINFDNRLSDLIEQASVQKLNWHDLVIVASLLEKEIQSDEDRRLVAGLINNRLAIGMPLQIDATITYLTGKANVKVTKSETEINSLYNTYLYVGLPAGPICHPGRASIEASLSPEENNYLYYLSTPNGETIFSRTLTEHNQAKAQYLK
jgi:UPF0755 protein